METYRYHDLNMQVIFDIESDFSVKHAFFASRPSFVWEKRNLQKMFSNLLVGLTHMYIYIYNAYVHAHTIPYSIKNPPGGFLATTRYHGHL